MLEGRRHADLSPGRRRLGGRREGQAGSRGLLESARLWREHRRRRGPRLGRHRGGRRIREGRRPALHRRARDALSRPPPASGRDRRAGRRPAHGAALRSKRDPARPGPPGVVGRAREHPRGLRARDRRRAPTTSSSTSAPARRARHLPRPRSPPDDVPTLEETLAALAGRVGLCVEVKERSGGPTPCSTRLERHAVDQDELILVSFQHREPSGRVRRRRPDVRCLNLGKPDEAAAGSGGSASRTPTGRGISARSGGSGSRPPSSP